VNGWIAFVIPGALAALRSKYCSSRVSCSSNYAPFKVVIMFLKVAERIV